MSSAALPSTSASPASRRGRVVEPGRVLLWVGCISMGLLFLPVVWAGPLALDEHVSYWMIDSELPAGMWTRCLDYGAVPPLSSLLQCLSISLFAKSEFALRLPSLVAAGLAIPLVYRVGQRLHGSLCGGVAACLLAWHPEVLDEVRIGRCYGLVLCLSTGLLLVTLRWREKPASLSRAMTWALVGAALIWTHYTAGLLVLVTWGAVAWSVLRCGDRRSALLGIACATGLTGLLCGPLWPALARLQEWSPYLNMQAPESPFWQTISSFWWLALPLGGVVAAILGRFGRGSDSTPAASLPWMSSGGWLMLACSLLPLVVFAVCAVGDMSSLANPRYRVAYAPAGAVWAAWLLSRSGSWKASTIGLLVTVCAAWSLMPLRPWQLGRLRSPADRDWQAINRSLATQASEGEPILVQSGLVESSLVPAYTSDPLFLEYAACRVSRFSVETPHPRWGLPFFWNEPTQQAYAEMLTTRASPVIWIACATDTDLNRSSLEGIRSVASHNGYQVTREDTYPHAVLLKMTR